MIVHIYECNDCGQRYPIVPYHRAAAPHGPKKNCTAPNGWTKVRECYPPTTHVWHTKAGMFVDRTWCTRCGTEKKNDGP